MEEQFNIEPKTPDKPAKTGLWGKLKHLNRWPKSHKKISWGIVIVAALLCLGAFWWFFRWHNVNSPGSLNFKKNPPVVVSPLTGLPVSSQAIADRPVTAVIIENSPDARPQSGLSEAGVVFEAVAEGGITRFVALYQEARPNPVGPVRSLRPYFFDWSKGFDASIAHVGGSPDALAMVRAAGQKDLDQFFNADSYWRATDRYAPHNVYTNFDKLDALNQQKGYTSSKFTPMPRKKDSPSKQPNATDINVDISSALYNPEFKYDAKDNSYIRYEAGSPHIDRNTNQPIEPKVVVVIKTAEQLDADGDHEDITDLDSGQAIVFQDGTAIQGTWSKPSASDMLTLTDSNNQPIKLNAGQVWFTVVADGRSVTWQ